MKSKTGLKTTTVLQVNSVIKMKKVLFVCTGNTCRSPMAEAIFNHLTDSKDLSAFSCGIYGDGVSPISGNAKTALSEIGIDFCHTSTPISKELVEDADYVIGMTENHARTIISMFPEYADKIYAMPSDISDPYGGNLGVYESCRDEIYECVKSLIKTLTGDNNG